LTICRSPKGRYHYFGSKPEVIEALAERLVGDSERMLAQIIADRGMKKTNAAGPTVADRDNRDASPDAAGHHVGARDGPLGADVHSIALIGGVGPDALVAKASGMSAELAVLIPGQPKTAIESDCDVRRVSNWAEVVIVAGTVSGSCRRRRRTWAARS
jgi:hypothetical protein